MAKQVGLFSLDTSAFYMGEEVSIENERRAALIRANTLKSAIKIEREFLDECARTETQEELVELNTERLKDLKAIHFIEQETDEIPDLRAMELEQKECVKKCKRLEEKLKATLEASAGIRQLRPGQLTPKHMIGVGESELTRALGIRPGESTEDLIIVRVFYYSVLKDLLRDGFVYNGERYISFTASAGQTRQKKFMFIKERRWQECKARLMCGLSEERINTEGTVGSPGAPVKGINIGKYLAYLALSSSTSTPWTDFDIDRCIVVNDFETNVLGCVDYIDQQYTCERQERFVPINHTDGCGMILPSKRRRNFMVRLPWVKGLLAPFPFDKFIREADKKEPGVEHGVITDVYGERHDVLGEGIEVIFTASQFKMWKYYRSWDEYKQFFKQHGCGAGIVKEDAAKPARAKLSYQMLQTLSNMTDDELRVVCAPTIEVLEKLSHDRDTMLRVFGAVKTNEDPNTFQQALMLYPELLRDEYCRIELRNRLRKIRDEAYSGHLETGCFYTFLIPDLYAFCQRLFGREQQPTGLLRDGEVYCRLAPAGQEVDCLRSPHLFLEHPVRHNLFGSEEAAGRAKESKRWFQTDGLYTSCHDLISKMLQFDNDGDTSLVVFEPTFVAAAKRHMEGIVPLYYDMGQAEPKLISDESIFEALQVSYKASVGLTTNEMTAHWNSDEISLDYLKVKCAEINFLIDGAKTLHIPKIPDELNEEMKQYKAKVPFFFQEAKDKDEEEVAPLNSSTVNRIRGIIPKPRLRFDKWQEKPLGKFEWERLASRKRFKLELKDDVLREYKKQVKNLGRYHHVEGESGENNLAFLGAQLRQGLLQVCPDIDLLVNILVRELFPRKKDGKNYHGTLNKRLFWAAFGEEVLANLKKNVSEKERLCVDCGYRFMPTSPRQVRCAVCAEIHDGKEGRERKRKKRSLFRETP